MQNLIRGHRNISKSCVQVRLSTTPPPLELKPAVKELVESTQGMKPGRDEEESAHSDQREEES